MKSNCSEGIALIEVPTRHIFNDCHVGEVVTSCSCYCNAVRLPGEREFTNINFIESYWLYLAPASVEKESTSARLGLVGHAKHTSRRFPSPHHCNSMECKSAGVGSSGSPPQMNSPCCTIQAPCMQCQTAYVASYIPTWWMPWELLSLFQPVLLLFWKLVIKHFICSTSCKGLKPLVSCQTCSNQPLWEGKYLLSLSVMPTMCIQRLWCDAGFAFVTECDLICPDTISNTTGIAGCCFASITLLDYRSVLLLYPAINTVMQPGMHCDQRWSLTINVGGEFTWTGRWN